MTFDQYEKQTVGGSGDIPAECRAKEDLGSPDDMFIRVKVTEQLLPEEPMGTDVRALPASQIPTLDGGHYDWYGG